MELNNVSADGIVEGRQASPLLELVTKVEADVAPPARVPAAVEAEDDAVLPAEAVEDAVPAVVEAAAVELGAVELEAVALGAAEPAGVELAVADVVLAELSEPQPPRAAKKEAHTNPAHTLSALNLKIIVTCPVAA